MRESEKNELLDRLVRIDEAICNAKYSIQHDEEPRSIQDAMFQFGAAKAYIMRLREDIRNTETDPEEDAPELPKPRRRGGRPKKKFTLDEDSPDPLE